MGVVTWGGTTYGGDSDNVAVELTEDLQGLYTECGLIPVSLSDGTTMLHGWTGRSASKEADRAGKTLQADQPEPAVNASEDTTNAGYPDSASQDNSNAGYSGIVARPGESLILDEGYGRGSRVRIIGLESRPGLNGKRGTLVAYFTGKGRWQVKIDGEDLLL